MLSGSSDSNVKVLEFSGYFKGLCVTHFKLKCFLSTFLRRTLEKRYIPGSLGTKDYRYHTSFRNSHLYFIFLFKKKSLKHMKFTGKLKESIMLNLLVGSNLL